MIEYIIKVDEDKKDIMGDCPLVDKPMELVRCKDCKHGQHVVMGETLYRVFCTKPYIERGNATHEADWFCADGEHKKHPCT